MKALLLRSIVLCAAVFFTAGPLSAETAAKSFGSGAVEPTVASILAEFAQQIPCREAMTASPYVSVREFGLAECKKKQFMADRHQAIIETVGNEISSGNKSVTIENPETIRQIALGMFYDSAPECREFFTNGGRTSGCN